jgi:hypothetical protein
MSVLQLALTFTEVYLSISQQFLKYVAIISLNSIKLLISVLVTQFSLRYYLHF